MFWTPTTGICSSCTCILCTCSVLIQGVIYTPGTLGLQKFGLLVPKFFSISICVILNLLLGMLDAECSIFHKLIDSVYYVWLKKAKPSCVFDVFDSSSLIAKYHYLSSSIYQKIYRKMTNSVSELPAFRIFTVFFQKFFIHCCLHNFPNRSRIRYFLVFRMQIHISIDKNSNNLHSTCTLYSVSIHQSLHKQMKFHQKY